MKIILIALLAALSFNSKASLQEALSVRSMQLQEDIVRDLVKMSPKARESALSTMDISEFVRSRVVIQLAKIDKLTAENTKYGWHIGKVEIDEFTDVETVTLEPHNHYGLGIKIVCKTGGDLDLFFSSKQEFRHDSYNVTFRFDKEEAFKQTMDIAGMFKSRLKLAKAGFFSRDVLEELLERGHKEMKYKLSYSYTLNIGGLAAIIKQQCPK
jgi:hypothetical protein